MQGPILESLQDVERRHQVRILYAVESGSRAWGFASADSDYDVRFLYVHPRDWYLSLNEGRDVIEEMLPNDLDLSGWDLRKALRLLQKSNPPLLEWLFSPIVYREVPEFIEQLRLLTSDGWSPKSLIHHYLSMAEGNFRTYLQGERVRAKKYLYVLRPLLAARWIEENGTLPPVLFAALLQLESDAEFLASVEMLLAQKQQGLEMEDLPADPVLHRFIESELLRYSEGVQVPHRKMNGASLDEFFRSWIPASPSIESPGLA